MYCDGFMQFDGVMYSYGVCLFAVYRALLEECVVQSGTNKEPTVLP